ncbi:MULTISPECIES: protocatechuate 3,4-dioxygenase subunit beta [Pseudomonas]|uniref:Protocatechuate 3,4-dioxygenase subunit beta n=1 Tax=Pseudomonas quercus TaxID=2722792 RepID=A0ABX0YHI1_9PSED|nr:MULTISPECIES: protocatechuate 3,4-dioxygenase subunit beta [Pseudomonas]MBF7143941.1 protocatechuate 3,4-dioxygenase subunit beta [Pseudomonas sp. LY10J]NJP02481.1 protocatechuate 3,4-dioxygenase subunit beta [Pseudomonas quercus]
MSEQDTRRFMIRDRNWHPKALTPDYKTSVPRSPRQALVSIPQTASESTGPDFSHLELGRFDNDLLLNFNQGGLPIGERIILAGRVVDQFGKPVTQTLVEIWQANAGGRYRHKNDRYLAPLDPNFGGVGRTRTNAEGYYSFRTVKPGPYPWRNGPNDWRPAHIHVSVSGPSIATRLITQLYFEGDPLIPMCPIVKSIANPEAVQSLVARLDMTNANPMDCLAYRFDIVLRGQRQTHFENC